MFLIKHYYSKVECPERLKGVEGNMFYFLYILKDENNNIYIGTTNNLDQRALQHLQKTTKAAKYTKDHGSFKIVYSEEYKTRAESMKREKQLKGWTKAKKEALIAGNLELLKKI